jgi:hypothetical protein
VQQRRNNYEDLTMPVLAFLIASTLIWQDAGV